MKKIFFIIAGALILLFIILYFIKRRKKQKEWMLFSKTDGYEDHPRTTFFAINKRTGVKKPAHPTDKYQKFKEPKEKIVEKIKIVPEGKGVVRIEKMTEEGW